MSGHHPRPGVTTRYPAGCACGDRLKRKFLPLWQDRSVVQCARLATPGRAGRDADEAPERSAERRFRFVAEPAGDLTERGVLFLESRRQSSVTRSVSSGILDVGGESDDRDCDRTVIRDTQNLEEHRGLRRHTKESFRKVKSLIVCALTRFGVGQCGWPASISKRA
jgi:hypothetical protein